MRLRDAVVVGGGPAGLAFAAAAARLGLDVAVVERRAGPVDKACGEGVLPAGLRALGELGALARIDRGEATEVPEIRWVERDGAAVALRLPAPGGLAVRRTALSAALAETARAAGAELVHGEVVAHARGEAGVTVEVAGAAGAADRFTLQARLLVAADGLASPIRRREGLDRIARGPRRYGVRRHFLLPPWTSSVEVHFGPGAEAYVWPAGPRQVGVAFLFEPGAEAGISPVGHVAPLVAPGEAPPPRPAIHASLLARFPALVERLAGAPATTAPLGAGPLARRSAARVRDRLVLLGDAAGYEDALTGEGLSLAFGCALDLARLAPEALARGASAAALAPYQEAWAARFRPYLAWTRTMLWLARHPAVRRRLVRLAAARRAPFERAMAAAVG
ncbi:MAG TPA: FAD-dependent monooxygenase [Anaeromyxobacteraceae bacterium]|nr:FAD-dependent monooxygenase [Anaeromyxobacteraceae bacterium]